MAVAKQREVHQPWESGVDVYIRNRIRRTPLYYTLYLLDHLPHHTEASSVPRPGSRYTPQCDPTIVGNETTYITSSTSPAIRYNHKPHLNKRVSKHLQKHGGALSNRQLPVTYNLKKEKMPCNNFQRVVH